MSGYSDAILADLPASGSYWPMNEASGSLADAGGGGNTLTPFNSPAGTRFAGGTGIFEFLGTASYSLEIWACPLSTPGSGWFAFTKRNATIDGWDWGGHLAEVHRWQANASDTFGYTAWPLSTWTH